MRDLYDIEIEQTILGSIFLTEKSFDDINAFISPNDFYDEMNKEIFSCMLDVYKKGLKIDYTIIIKELEKKNIIGKHNENEYFEYILNLTKSVMSLDNLIQNIGIINEYSQKRMALKNFTELSEKLDKIDIADLEYEVKKLANSFDDNTDFENKEGFCDMSDYIDDFITDLETPINPDDIFKLGFPILDSMVMLEKTNLMIIGADTGVGKTAFALNLVRNFCKQNKNVFFVSQEMGKKEVTRRMVALEGNVKAQDLKNKKLTSTDWANVMSAKEKVKKWNFKIYDKGDMNVELLHTIVSRLKKQKKIDVLVVDYLQLISTRKSKFNRASEVEEVSRQMKQIGMQFGIPVIVLSQFSRSVVQQDGKVREPQKSDLKGSSSIEQDANIILLLHTQDMEQKFQEKRFIDLAIKKQRDGVLGKTHFSYYGDYIRFIETKWNDTKRQFEETKIDIPDL